MIKGKLSLIVVVCLFLVGAVLANAAVKINESETRAVLSGGLLQIDLAVGNDGQKNVSAFARLEILDAYDNVLARSETVEKIKSGQDALRITLQNVGGDVKKLLWYRLRYSINADGISTAGIVSLSEILHELFELRVAASKEIYAGMRYSARVRAFHPTKNTPASNVQINARLEIDLETDEDNDDLKITAAGETDAEGFAMLEFQIPENVIFSDNWSGKIEVKGVRNNLESMADEPLQTKNNQISVYFLTDKPLYQPNQKIYIRGLALRNGANEAGTTVAADKELEFTIKDEGGITLYRQTLKTSRFGIAAIEWQIPESAKLGTYKVDVKADEELAAHQTQFKVSRYDLPNFVVQTKADKAFYLPGDATAEVAVDALYLFGKPVASGKVRVVREGRREWSYSEQKWDIQEEDVYEGETTAEGKYVAKIDLSKAHENLSQDEQFKDLNFTAYYTDFSTNKTEQKRFDVRVTREPIHIYLTGKSSEDHNPKLPFNFYVSTFTADGKPLACDVEIRGKYTDEKEEKILTKFKTNKLGASKARFSAPKREDGVYFDDLQLNISARDDKNKTGTKKEEIEISQDEKQIFVRTDKSIYRKGEPVKIEILSSETEETVFVDVSKHLSSLDARRVKLKNGRAELKIPYNQNFKNALTVSAYIDDGGDTVRNSHTIIYPMPNNLRVNATSAKNVFRPNEEATVNFDVSAPGKQPTETALGIVIVDKAVEERAKTDALFGGVAGIFQDFGSLTGNTWNEMDMKKNIPAELQLFAEMRFFNAYYQPNFFDSEYSKSLEHIFAEKIRKEIGQIQPTLAKRYSETFEHPTDDASLRKILSQNKIDFDALRDPWGNAYRAEFSVYFRSDVIEIKSAGANKIFGDADDFAAQKLYFEYFKPTQNKIDKAVSEYFKKTGRYVLTVETLREALTAQDINADEALKDRWGEPYHINFGMYYRNYSITFRSGGADKKFGDSYYDNFEVWTNYIDYFAQTERKIEAVLNKFTTEKKTFPKDEAEFKQVLRDGGIDFDALRDGWNRPFYLQIEVMSRVGDRVVIENVARQGEKPKETLNVTPVTQKIAVVRIRSLGAGGVKNESWWDNYVFSTFAGIVSEQAADGAKSKIVVSKASLANGKSAIYGIVTDRNNAVIANADVTITSNYQTQTSFETKTNDEGVYLQTNLPAGRYMVKATSSGFKTSIINEINVVAEKLTEINLTLEVGSVAETVLVTADSSVTIDTTSTKLSTNITSQLINELPSGTQFSSLLKIAPNIRPEPLSGGFQIDGASGSENVFVMDGQEVTNFRSGALNKENDLPANERKSTPRLREYFPETLLWMPELITDANGKAELKFRLADNITTWKIYAIASDAKGKVGITEKEIRAFQPFFVDLEPPKFLTSGDEIFLPVQVRNYTKLKQTVAVEMTKADWFNFLDAGNKQVEVGSNASQNAIFGFRADKAVEEGRQKVTAIADTDSDAIEKSVTVRPNGQEIVKTESKLFYNSAAFDINFPANALPETQKAELKIYPNLLAHVTESVEGLLKRPYGCGEQTISSTYPNLMILKFTGNEKKDASSIPRISFEVRNQAKNYLQKGYERLLGYQTGDNGFSYWGSKDTPNIALTAYAIRFLSEARGFIEVDEKVIANTQSWLLRQQRADGSWSQNGAASADDSAQTKLFTAYVARSLAMTEKDKKSPAAQAALQKAFGYLKPKIAEINEPHTLALFGLASLDAGNSEFAGEIAAKLEKMSSADGDAIYWKLEANTPFYGWGAAGQIETTALVVQLLIREAQARRLENATRNDLISRGTMFLLKNKDRFGVWYSTQTTINVLDAFLATLSGDGEMGNNSSQNIEISLNGENLQSFTVSPDQIAPVILNLTGKLNPLANRLEIKGSTNAVLMSQIVSTHYIDWRDANISSQTRDLRLDYKCDKTDAKIMEEVNCEVITERIGYRNYGMLLAEIGLPPGADVSRESLEQALKDWSVSRYEVLPDRIILYMWSRPGGTKLNFKFRPRYAVNAQTPASFVYDYYNEEAKAMLAPMKFSVK